MMSIRKRFAATGLMIGLMVGLSGCDGLIGAVKGPSNLFNLTPKTAFPQGMPKVKWQLVVEEPLANGGLNTARIALRPNHLEVKYFADARWTERAPKMVQTLLVESFENTGRIVSVGRQVIGLRSDFNLKTELREFQVEEFGSRKVRVRINAKLVAQPRQTIVASQSFESAREIAGKGMAASIRAWDSALGDVLKQVVMWTLDEGRAAQHRKSRRR